METIKGVPPQDANIPTELQPLPFTYQRTFDPEQARYKQWRISPVSIAGEKNKPKSEAQIVESVRQQRESTDWFLSEYWRKKGIPQEQVEFQVGDQLITIYNYNQEKPFTDDHMMRMESAFSELTTRFPQAIERIRWILIDDIAHASGYGDPEKYPLNGNAMPQWQAFRFLPRGTELMPHRVRAISNFEGTFMHEMTHLIDRDFEQEWEEKFKWDFCVDHPEDWESRPTPDGTEKKFFNKETGEMSPQGYFSLQPDQCVTYYARQSMSEDICDCMVAYVYDPDLLKKVSEDKYEILSKHDARASAPEISSQRIPQDAIKLPEIKPEIVRYFIVEPNPQETP